MTRERDGRRRRLPWALFAALLLHVGLRAAILATNFDIVAFTAYEQFPMGTLPAVILDGIEIPLTDLYDNAAGQLLVGYLAAPFYAWLGPTYLALKLVPFLLGIGVLLLLWRFCDEHFGRGAANAAALLFAIGPATLVKYSLFASGNHFENLFFSLLATLCFYRLHTAGGRRGPRLALAGATAGLALFVFLGALLPIGLCVLAHVAVRGARGTLRDLAVGLPAFLVGAAPLLWLNLSTGGRGLGFLRAKFGLVEKSEAALAKAAAAPPGKGIPERLADFFGRHLPDAPTSEGLAGIDGSWFDALFLVAFLVAWATFLPDAVRGARALLLGLADWRPEAQRSREEERARFRGLLGAPLVALLPLTGLAYALSDLRMGADEYTETFAFSGYRYFNWHLLVALILVAGAASRHAARGRRGLAALLVALPAVAFLPDLALPDWGGGVRDHGLRYAGPRHGQIARALLGGRNANTREENVAVLDAFPLRQRREIYEGVGFCESQLRFVREDPLVPVVPLEPLLGAWDEPYHDDIARGVGRALRQVFEFQPDRDRVRPLLAAHPEGSPRWRAVHEGFFEPWSYTVVSRTRDLLERNHQLFLMLEDTEAEAPASRGHGIVCGQLARRGIAEDLALVDEVRLRVKPVRRRSFYHGFGFGFARQARDAVFPAALLERLDGILHPEIRRFGFLGYGAGVRHRAGVAGLAARTAPLGRGLTEADRRDLRIGAGLEAWVPGG
jgi:hypothetical protein